MYLYLDWGPDVHFSAQTPEKFWKSFYRYIFHFLTKCYGDELTLLPWRWTFK